MNNQNLIPDSYQFPEYYYWPIFFTFQKHENTKRKQIKMWCALTLTSCKDNKIFRLSKSDFYENIGRNNKIQRRLNFEDINTIFDNLVLDKKAMYVNNDNHDELFMLWKTIPEWENFFYNSSTKKKSIGKLETLDYLCYDEDNKYEEYYNMDRELLIIILKQLESKGKCNLVKDDNNSYMGVQFIE